MKFIRKHSTNIKNHWSDGDLINNDKLWIATVDKSYDADLFSAAPEMLDYIITAATEIESGLAYLESLPEDITNQIPKSMDKFKKEFNDLIELIKKAGVEVVE